MIKRKLVTLLLSIVLVASAVSMAPVRANADSVDCGDTTPVSSSFEVVDGGDNWSDTAYINFQLSRAEIRALRCSGSHLSVDFRMNGYVVDDQTKYEFSSDTLSTGDHYLWLDGEHDVIMTLVLDVGELVAGQEYDLELYFGGFFPVQKDAFRHLLTATWAPTEVYQKPRNGRCMGDTHVLVTEQGSYCQFRYEDEDVYFGEYWFGY